MSSIFDVVESATSQRKTRVLQSSHGRSVFTRGNETTRHNANAAPEIQASFVSPLLSQQQQQQQQQQEQLSSSNADGIDFFQKTTKQFTRQGYPVPPQQQQTYAAAQAGNHNAQRIAQQQPVAATHNICHQISANKQQVPEQAYSHSQVQTQYNHSQQTLQHLQHEAGQTATQQQHQELYFGHKQSSSETMTGQSKELSNEIRRSLKYCPESMPASITIDIVWGICVFCSLVPVFLAVIAVMNAPIFSPDMLRVPYQCNIFYLSLFSGLPGITVHIFCLSLIFHRLCRSGILLSIISIGLLIITIEHACISVPSVSVDNTFYLLAISTYLGLISQALFISMLYHPHAKKRILFGTAIGLGLVLVTLSVLSIALSVLNSEIPHTKSTVLVRIIPLSTALLIYTLSTYWTLFPIRVVCNNM